MTRQTTAGRWSRVRDAATALGAVVATPRGDAPDRDRTLYRWRERA